MHKHLRFDIFELQETNLPVRLINATNERRLVQGHGVQTIPMRIKGDIEDVFREMDNGALHFLDEIPKILLPSAS
ncbi:uncharacterized protein TNCV_930981 [Trichonephila clavipes]|uniref:Uncharacterized protein n=1 Tax=Trichonephila clavipes TaxID=2585209 RepID=A0A8X7BDZ0_TRICX|nr:uncharacterized protein TNCV_930981 [Trichonephila clavipes]